MNNEYGIIISPVVTEKNNDLASQNKYVFKVSPRAGKIEIGKAVEKLFKVKVAKVNTISVRGKMKRMGRYSGYTAAWKKAIVTLKADSKPIEFFDGLM